MSTVALSQHGEAAAQCLLYYCNIQLPYIFQPENGTKKRSIRDTVHSKNHSRNITKKPFTQYGWNENMSALYKLD